MANRLFIAEKPSLAKEIAKGLGASRGDGCFKNGKGDVVTWCYGHILEQFNPDEYDASLVKWDMKALPIIPKVWKMKVKDDCKKQFNIIKKLVGEADTIVNAGDPDREGQLLVDEVLEYLGNRKPVQRILVNALDEKSIAFALNHLRDNKEFSGMCESARARSRADWLVGINLTRAYTIMAQRGGYRGIIHIGRVQTPTLALVVRREQEIKNFVPKDYFTLKAVWHHANGDIISAWEPGDNAELDSDGKLLNKSVADAVYNKIQESIARIASVEMDKKKESPRLPYSLSTLQVEAGVKFGYTPQEVLDTMQSLYEKKYTTYPRSDCNYLPENQLADASVVMKNIVDSHSNSDDGRMFASCMKEVDLNKKSKAWNDKKVTAHHAIIPTTVKCPLDELSTKEKNMYTMVAKAYFVQFLPEHEYMATKITLTAEKEKFKATGKTVIRQGWKVLYHGNEDDEKLPALPKVDKDDTAPFKSGGVESRKTTPPKRYTEATLLKDMKEIHKHVRNAELKGKLKSLSGIGTEATRATIIDGLVKNGFMKTEKKYLVPTDVANVMIKILPSVITYPDTTAMWEDILEKISNNEVSVENFTTAQTRMIGKLIEQADKTDTSTLGLAKSLGKCPRCGKNIYDKGKSFSCEGYPKCTFAIWKKPTFGILKGHTISAMHVQKWLAGEKIKFTKLKSKAGKEFDALLKMHDTGEYVNFDFEFEKSKIPAKGKKKAE